jgi:hypothetical protein
MHDPKANLLHPLNASKKMATIHTKKNNKQLSLSSTTDRKFKMAHVN